MAELASMSNVDGMLSFLDRTPQDYAVLFHKDAPLPQQPDKKEDSRTTNTVDVIPESTVDHVTESTVDRELQTTADDDTKATVDSDTESTVNLETPATVDLDSMATVDDLRQATVDPEARTTADPAPQTTVDPDIPIDINADLDLSLDSTQTTFIEPGDSPEFHFGPGSTAHGPRPAVVYWYTESPRNLFPSKRVRSIGKVQEALSLTEEAVYDVLWGPKINNKDEFRIVRMGYDAIHKAARISKRKVADIIDRLIEKGFLQIEIPADILSRTPTQYRVYGYRMAKANMRARGRTHVVRSGNGVLFAYPLTQPWPTIDHEPQSTVDAGLLSTDDPGSRSTGAPRAQSTGDPSDGSTVDPGATSLLGISSSDTPADKPSAAPADAAVSVIAAILREELGTVDNDAAIRIVANCRAKAPDATPREFAILGRSQAQRLKTVRSVDNPIAMMITRLSRSFEGEAFVDFRAAERQLKDQQIRQCQYAIDDPEEFEEVKEQARTRLAELRNE